MAERWKRCARGNCLFKDGAGTSLTLPEPRRAEKRHERRSDNLVYDAVSVAAAPCRGDCQCFIVVQGMDARGNIETEVLYTANGDAQPYEVGNDRIGPLTKTEVDGWSRKQTEHPSRTYNFTCACIEMEISATGKRQPVPN